MEKERNSKDEELEETLYYRRDSLYGDRMW